jgi:peptidoglycan/LPS O-acetylase OafA/YrhL
LSPSAWALTVELFYYLIICFGISKTEKRTKFWLLLGFVYTLALLIFDRQWEDRYFPIAAASLPFALGSYLYFVLKRNRWRSLLESRYLNPVWLTGLLIVNFAFHYAIERLTEIPLVFQTGFYLNLVIVTLIVVGLASGKKYPFINKKWDKKIGDFSYPIYLLHWQIGLLVSFLILGEPYRGNTGKGAIVLLVALPVTLLISFLMIKAIDRPIEQIRSWMKPKKAAKMPPVEDKNVTPLPK